MKAPLSWIRDYVDVKADAAKVADALSMAGVGVEAVEGDVFDLEITANRADLLSILGVGREVALAFGKPLREPAVKYAETKEKVSAVAKVVTEDLDLCPRYTARVVRGIRMGPSPAWMQAKLEAAGLRPVNNIVDITNFVLLECGQPLHAFDLALLKGAKIVVRTARKGEKITAIDGKEYPLDARDLVIADAERPVAVAGVMGGLETEIRESTADVLIESAQFDPVSVRRTSRRLGLSSESSYRFERGVDWETVDWASRRAAQLMAELAGGKVCAGVADVAAKRERPKPVNLRFARVDKVLGMKVPAARVRAILKGLGCRVLGSGNVKIGVEVPPRRKDLRAEIDLIEEVARVVGYGNVPCDTELSQRTAVDRGDDRVRDRARAELVSMGGYEVCTWSFAEAGTSNRVPYWSKADLVPLRDPEGKVDRLLRESLVPEFLRVLAMNDSYKEPLRAIFEIASVYFPAGGGYSERGVLALAAPGPVAGVKGLVANLLDRLGVEAGFREEERPHLSPGTGLSILAGDRSLGYLGEPAPQLCEKAGLKREAGVAELDFAALVELSRLDRKYREFSRRPPVDRDLAVIVAEEVRWGRIEELVRGAGPEWLERVTFFDVYRGNPVAKGSKSVAFSMRFRSPDRTLRGGEVDRAVEGIVEALKREIGAVLRG